MHGRQNVKIKDIGGISRVSIEIVVGKARLL